MSWRSFAVMASATRSPTMIDRFPLPVRAIGRAARVNVSPTSAVTRRISAVVTDGMVLTAHTTRS
jgi:hypothetical protein